MYGTTLIVINMLTRSTIASTIMCVVSPIITLAAAVESEWIN